MKKVSSLKYYKVKCPVCGTPNEFKGIKPKAYVETGRDTDFCPLARDWQDSKHRIKNPLLFLMATCKRCFFTHELNKDLIEWKNHPEFRSPAFVTLKRKHLEEFKQKNGIIKRMSKSLRPCKDPFSTAVIKFLLGIYDESLKPAPSYYNLGRYYLRVGWIFREERKKEESAWIKENLTHQSLGETLKSIQVQHADYLKKMKKLKEEVQFEFESETKSIKDRSDFLIDHIIKELNTLKGSLDQLQHIHQDYQNKPLANMGNDLFRFEDFLFALKMQWHEIPINEKEALELSLANYKKSLTQGLKENQKIRISYLIGELSRRIGDLNSAKEYLDLAINVGQDFIQKNEDDPLKTALAQRILEMAYQQKEVISRGRERVL